MKGLILARIERIRRGHSDRSLVHAVAEGLDYKIEVPTDEVASLGTGEGHMLVLSWSIHPSPAVTVTSEGSPSAEAPPSAATPVRVDAQFMSMMNRGTDGSSGTLTAPTPAAPTPAALTPAAPTPAPTASSTASSTSSPASVDEQFMTLMNRSQSGAPAPDAATSLSGPERQLASLLGLPTRG